MKAIGTQLRDLIKFDGGIKVNGILQVSTRFSLSVEDGQADVVRDGRTRLARPNSLALTRTRKHSLFPCSADNEQEGQSYPVHPYSAIINNYNTYTFYGY